MNKYEINQEFNIKFTNEENKTVEKSVTDVDTMEDAYMQARSSMCDEQNLSRSEFENNWSVETKRRYVSFDDPPWAEKDLEEEITDIEGVRYARYSPPLRGAYGPPKFKIGIEGDTTTEAVKQNILNYYGGFSITEWENSTLTVIVSPTRKLKESQDSSE